MSNCPGCDSSSTTYSRCQPPVSTNCVFYQGESKVCKNDTTFTICKGENLSELQLKIFEKVCTIAGDINITSIEFPCSLQDAWEDEDPTILNLLQYMVNIQCQQNELIQNLQDQLPALNPQVEVCLTCCGNECGTGKMLLSQALDEIIKCLCTVKTIAEDATTQANNAYSKVTQYEKRILYLEYSNCRLTKNNIALTTTVNSIVNYLNNNTDASLGLTAPDYTGCPLPPANIILNG